MKAKQHSQTAALSLLDFVPRPELIRVRILELQSEQRKLESLLTASEEIQATPEENSVKSRPTPPLN